MQITPVSNALGANVSDVALDELTDDQADAIVSAIAEAANTQKIGDGKIFVTEVSDAVRIRTGERGEAAL